MSQLDRDSRVSTTPARSAPGRSVIRRGATLGVVGAALTVVSGAWVAVVVQPGSSVSAEQFSFPWSPSALVPVSIVYAVFHVLVLLGVVALSRSGLTGTSRPARVGAGIAVAGTALLTLAELASLGVRDQLVSDSGAGMVGATFGLATALSMIGFLLLGVTTLRAGRWSGWGRFTPLAVGITLVALMGLVVTPALAVGVGLYGLALFTTFVAVARHR